VLHIKRKSPYIFILFYLYGSPSFSNSIVNSEELGPVRYHIMKHHDYQTITGCNVDRNRYNQVLEKVLDYLVFKSGQKDEVKQYSSNFFRRLKESQNKKGDSTCLHPILKTLHDKLWNDYYDRDQNQQFSINTIVVYEVLPRSDYMEITGCKVTWRTYRLFWKAFINTVFREDLSKAKISMQKFLQVLIDSGHKVDIGKVSPRCSDPSLQKLITKIDDE
jgi:hypothetical protein